MIITAYHRHLRMGNPHHAFIRRQAANASEAKRYGGSKAGNFGLAKESIIGDIGPFAELIVLQMGRIWNE